MKPGPTNMMRTLAVAGIVGIAAWFLVQPLMYSKIIDHTTPCLTTLKQLATATAIYTADYDDRLMPRDFWMDSLYPYHKNHSLEHCPLVSKQSGGNKSLYGYSFNSKVAQIELDEIPDAFGTPLLYDSVNLGRSASDPFSSLPSPPRVHREGGPPANYVAYIDGHVRAIVSGK